MQASPANNAHHTLIIITAHLIGQSSSLHDNTLLIPKHDPDYGKVVVASAYVPGVSGQWNPVWVDDLQDVQYPFNVIF